MDASVFTCPGCGQPVDVDFKTRKGLCNWCGNVVTFPRTRFNSDDKVQNELALAVRYFEERRLDDAKTHADGVLSVAIDNAPALFIRAYYESYAAANRNSERIADFFRELETIEADGEEVPILVKLFLLSAHKLEVHIEKVLAWAKENLPRDDLLKFADEICPSVIMRSGSADFFTPQLVATLKEIAATCSIPKTCYALLAAIEKNPDSPYPNDRFFLRTKTRRFYDEFVLPVGEVIGSMESMQLKDKFYYVFEAQREKYENKMKGGNN